jgi:hypothetical protein
LRTKRAGSLVGIIVVLIVALWAIAGVGTATAAPALGAPEFSGSAEYQFHYGFEAKEITGDSLKLSLALDGDIGARAGYHVDACASLSTKPEIKSELKLGEAYLDMSLGPVDVRLGNQLVNWGTADGINPTSVVNPRDLLSVTDLGIAGAPVPAIAATYYFGSASAITGVLVLDFVPAAIPGQLAQVEPEGKPDSLRDKLEFAVRGETMLGGHNVYASYFRGWQDLPAAWLRATELPDPYPPFAPHLKYRRMHQFGLATAGTLGDAAVWLEGAVTVPDKLEELDAPPPATMPMSSNDSSFQVVLGADYTFNVGTGLFASAQIIYDSANALLSPYTQPGEERKAGVYSLLVARYSPADDHQLELVGLVDLRGKAGLVIPRYTYRPAQAVELSIGAITGFGDDTSPLGAAVPAARGVIAGMKASF